MPPVCFSFTILRCASVDGSSRIDRSSRSLISGAAELKERVRVRLGKLDVSSSAYDTAWVAMVPAPGDRRNPCFRQCVQWILHHQHADGSWGLGSPYALLGKDTLSCTLACVLALERWGVGDEHVRKGLQYLGSNISTVWNDEVVTPVGFNVVFPGMVGLAIDMGLDIPMHQDVVHLLFAQRDAEVQSCYSWDKAHIAYVAEGLGGSVNWSEIMLYQRKNGSLFNSPSTTAAALTHLYDPRALNYLNYILQKFHDSVPTMYPLEMYNHLRTVDCLKQVGVAEHFKSEIRSILDEVYSCWSQRDEEIMCNATTCAMAFRLLRLNGYAVSSDELSHYCEDHFIKSLPHYEDLSMPYSAYGCQNAEELLELYKASQIKVSSNELILDKLQFRSSSLLRKLLYKSQKKLPPSMAEEVDYALKIPLCLELDRLVHKRSIENFSMERFKVLKASYVLCWCNEDLLAFAIKMFNISQSIYREELEQLERWVKVHHLDRLEFARQKLLYCYFSAAATLYSPESSDMRISWTKNSVLTTVVDDFFDVGGSMDELESLISLVERWDGIHAAGNYSNNVKIIYSAIYATITDIGRRAFAVQRRSVTGHLIEIWLGLLKSMMIEAEWQRNKQLPTVEHYMANGVISFALGPIILPTLYFVGSELSEDVVGHSEYRELFRLVSTCGRSLNDIRTYEVEGAQGKLNLVSLVCQERSSPTSIDDAKEEIKNSVDACRSDLLGLVLREGTVVPRPCKELFWKMCNVLHLFYMNTDGFSSPKEMLSAANAVIHEPIRVSTSSVST